MVRVTCQTGIFIKEDGSGLIERDTMFLSIGKILGLVPGEPYISHMEKIYT